MNCMYFSHFNYCPYYTSFLRQFRLIDLKGDWYGYNPHVPREGLTKIFQQGNHLTFINEVGDKSNGYFLNDNIVIATNWSNLQGIITSDGDMIDWRNNTWWMRKPFHDNVMHLVNEFMNKVGSGTEIASTFDYHESRPGQVKIAKFALVRLSKLLKPIVEKGLIRCPKRLKIAGELYNWLDVHLALIKGTGGVAQEWIEVQLATALRYNLNYSNTAANVLSKQVVEIIIDVASDVGGILF